MNTRSNLIIYIFSDKLLLKVSFSELKNDLENETSAISFLPAICISRSLRV